MGLLASPKSPIPLYGVATVSRTDKIIGLFCRILSLLFGSFAKETYNFIDPANQSHPIFEESHTLYRVAKTHRMPYLYRSFSAKEPYI